MKNKYFTVILLMFLILTFSLTTFAAGINLDINQDVPSAYINDSEGQDYSLTIENRGTETAENTELQIDIPQGFSYKEGSLSAFLKNDIGDSGTKKTTNISIDGNTINIEFDPQLDLNANQILDINYKLSTDKTVTDGFKTITVTTPMITTRIPIILPVVFTILEPKNEAFWSVVRSMMESFSVVVIVEPEVEAESGITLVSVGEVC